MSDVFVETKLWKRFVYENFANKFKLKRKLLLIFYSFKDTFLNSVSQYCSVYWANDFNEQFLVCLEHIFFIFFIYVFISNFCYC